MRLKAATIQKRCKAYCSGKALQVNEAGGLPDIFTLAVTLPSFLILRVLAKAKHNCLVVI